MFCPQCGLEQEDEYRFCVACGAALPRGLVRRRGPKVSRWFWGIPVIPEDGQNMALRVSRYLEELEIHTPDGSVRVPSHHVRFSIWVDDHATCALSLPDHEAEALAAFLMANVTNGDGRGTEPATLG
jgi:hypothetical protein